MRRVQQQLVQLSRRHKAVDGENRSAHDVAGVELVLCNFWGLPVQQTKRDAAVPLVLRYPKPIEWAASFVVGVARWPPPKAGADVAVQFQAISCHSVWASAHTP